MAALVIPMAVATFGAVGLAPAPMSFVAHSGLSTAGLTLPSQSFKGVASHPAVPAASSGAYARIGPKLAAEKPAAGSGSTSNVVTTPGCLALTCPMGITDYGITPSLTTYSYSYQVAGSYWDSGDSFGVAYSSGGGCVDPNAMAGTCATLQQNLVVQKLPVKNNNGSYWVQNVPEVAQDSVCSAPCVSYAYSVTFIDNIWNFSNSHGICPSGLNGGKGCINPANFVGNLPGNCVATGGAPDFYYCVGPTVYNVTPPFTVEAFTELNLYGFPNCVHSAHQNCINFYGEVSEGSVPVYGSHYDEVAVKSGSKGSGSPSFLVKDALTPFGLPYDYEWVFGGPGGGSSNDLASNGDLQSFYCVKPAQCGTISGYKSIPHAWSSGADTAETIHNVFVAANFNPRDLAPLAYQTENPQTSIW